MNHTIRSSTSVGKQNNQSKYCFIQPSSDALSCCLAVAPKLTVRTVRGVQYFRILQFSQGKQVFRKSSEHSAALTISALYHPTKPEPVEKQKMHKTDLIHLERVILTS
jgi:hypothetical protein